MGQYQTEVRELYQGDRKARDIVAMLCRRERKMRTLYYAALQSFGPARDFLVTLRLTEWAQAHNAAALARQMLD